MLVLRRPRPRSCGLAAALFAAVLWPALSPVGSETPAALEPTPLWLAPAFASSPATSSIALAVQELAEGRPTLALPILTRVAGAGGLGGYPVLYLGQAQLALNKIADARATTARLTAMRPSGYLADAARWLAADVAEAAGDWAAAEASLRELVAGSPVDPGHAGLRLGLAAAKAGDRAQAIAALRAVYDEYPLSPQAIDAEVELTRLGVSLAPVSPGDRSRLETRARALFDARRYADARAAFVLLHTGATGDERRRLDLRLAVCDFSLKRLAAARDRLRPLAAGNPEAEFFLFSTLRELGRRDEYVARARAFIAAHPTDRLAEAALNDLGTHFILANEDDKAGDTFAEMYARFPTGPHAARAVLKGGWWRYRSGAYADAIRMFESAADTLPRNDYRPLWLYWAARAHQKLGQRDLAVAGFGRVIADYRNSYYGREAVRRLADLNPGAGQVPVTSRALPASIQPGDPPPNAGMIRDLLAAGLFDAAILELRKVQIEYGASPLVGATIAYALNRRGDLRDGIVRMRTAYPEFRADGGELLPAEIRRVIFPMAHWDLVQFHARAQKLDPYLMAALINQESTFQADVKSSAGAWGLMQIMPATGRRLAARLNIRPFSTARLKQPEINVRLGMANFAILMAKYGDLVPALAAYNAGDTPVGRWLAERRDWRFDQDEFIDDIPYPETQNYVKRILGTADDYRALYGDRSVAVRR